MARHPKPLSELSAASRQRIERFASRNGLTAEQVYNNASLRKAAYGHGSTPRHPEDALRYPLAYQAYIGRNRPELEELVRTNDKSRQTYERALRRIDKTITQQEIKRSPIILPFLRLVDKPPPNWTRRPTVPNLVEAVNYGSDVWFLDPVATKGTRGTYTIWLPLTSVVIIVNKPKPRKRPTSKSGAKTKPRARRK
jgi:hypothetical protein